MHYTLPIRFQPHEPSIIPFSHTYNILSTHAIRTIPSLSFLQTSIKAGSDLTANGTILSKKIGNGGSHLLGGLPTSLGAVLEGCEETEDDNHHVSPVTHGNVTDHFAVGDQMTSGDTATGAQHTSSQPPKVSSSPHTKRPPLSPPPLKPARLRTTSSPPNDNHPSANHSAHARQQQKQQDEAGSTRIDTHSEGGPNKEHSKGPNNERNNEHNKVHNGKQEKAVHDDDEEEEMLYLNETFDEADDDDGGGNDGEGRGRGEGGGGGGDGEGEHVRGTRGTYNDVELMIALEEDADVLADGEKEVDLGMEGEGDISHGILFSISNDAGSPQRNTGQGNDDGGVVNMASDDDDDLLWDAREDGGQVDREGEGEEEEERDLALAISEDSFDMLGKLLSDLPPVGTKKAPPPPLHFVPGSGLVPGTRTDAKASGQGKRSSPLKQQQQVGPANANTTKNNHHSHGNNNNNNNNSNLTSLPRGVSSPTKQPNRGKIVASSLSKPLTLTLNPREGTAAVPPTTTAQGMGASLQLSVGNGMANRYPSPGAAAGGGHRANSTQDTDKKTTTAIPKQFTFPSSPTLAPAPPLSTALAAIQQQQQQQQQHGPGKGDIHRNVHRNGKSLF